MASRRKRRLVSNRCWYVPPTGFSLLYSSLLKASTPELGWKTSFFFFFFFLSKAWNIKLALQEQDCLPCCRQISWVTHSLWAREWDNTCTLMPSLPLGLRDRFSAVGYRGCRLRWKSQTVLPAKTKGRKSASEPGVACPLCLEYLWVWSPGGNLVWLQVK